MLFERDNLAQVGGGGRIRTSDTLSDIPLFESGAFNHSATPPCIFICHSSVYDAEKKEKRHALLFFIPAPFITRQDLPESACLQLQKYR